MSKGIQSQSINIDVVGSSTFGVDSKVSPSKTYNMLISNGALVGGMGYKKLVDLLPSGAQSPEGRGIFRSIRGIIFIAVINSEVWKITKNGNYSIVGKIDSSRGNVFMDENLNGQICIVDQFAAYIYNRIDNSFTKQSLGADLIPNYVIYHNTYFLFGNADISGNGAKWFAYSFDTNTTIKETFELALETKPDYAKAVVRIPGLGNNVLVIGESVCEIHTNVGGLLGYQRVSTKNIDYGCSNVATIAFSDRFIVWLATNQNSEPVILTFDGQSSSIISTDGINNILKDIKNPDSSAGMMYKIYGHLIYQLTFYHPDDDITLIYDFNESKFYHASDFDLSYHPARQFVYAEQLYFFVSLKDGAIYESSSDLTSYDSNALSSLDDDYLGYKNRVIPRQRICSTIRTGEKFRIRRIPLTLKQGDDTSNMQLDYENRCMDNIVTIVSPEDMLTIQGEPIVSIQSGDCLTYQPRVDLSFSKDGGETYSADVGRDIRFLGYRQNEMSWERLGAANEFTPKFKFWGNNKFVILDAKVEISL